MFDILNEMISDKGKQKLNGKALREYRRKNKNKHARKSRKRNKTNGSTRPSNW